MVSHTLNTQIMSDLSEEWSENVLGIYLNFAKVLHPPELIVLTPNKIDLISLSKNRTTSKGEVGYSHITQILERNKGI